MKDDLGTPYLYGTSKDMSFHENQNVSEYSILQFTMYDLYILLHVIFDHSSYMNTQNDQISSCQYALTNTNILQNTIYRMIGSHPLVVVTFLSTNTRILFIE